MPAKLLTLLLLLTGGPENGPTGTLEGTVRNNDNVPLSHAHIVLPELDKGTVTHRDGSFLFSGLAAGDYRIIVSHIGYENGEKTVTIQENEVSEAHFELIARYEMPQVEIVGRSPDRLARIPGSAARITPEQLEQVRPVSNTEIFRQIPGIHAVDHEGMGLRANIGIRGLDPDRSRNVLILEDGIPVALAPYGEPEMYYTPPVARMEAIEVIKGSGSIKFGPRTIGGVINYMTPDPPPEPEITGNFSGGNGGYFTSNIGYGNSFGNSGFRLGWLHQRGEEIGSLRFQQNDLNARWKVTMSSRSVLGAKLGIYDEVSNSTYVGLSQPMYESGKYHFTDLAPDDELKIRRYSASLTFDHFFSDYMRLNTSAYAYTTRRNWSRQDFNNRPVDGRSYDRIVGDPNESYGALYFLPATGNRNREFEVAGIEPRLNARFYLGDFRNELDTGLRFHFERAFEQRINGSIESPATGDIRDDEIRTGHAASAFVQNRFYLNPRLTVTPGLRLEHFRYEREILRNNFNDLRRTTIDETTAWIPGLGINYRFGAYSSLFAGVHRGFSPPRIKDAITTDGNSEELDSEWSWSYEAGIRLQPRTLIRTEITAYYMTFENQIIPVSESAGGQGLPNAAGLTNGGATEHYGLEFLVTLGPVSGNRLPFSVEWDLGGTWNHATFSEDRFVTDGDEMVNVAGNELPYAPEWNGFTRFSLDHISGLSGNIKATYTGEQFGDVLNRTEPAPDGREGMLDRYTVLDAGLQYRLPTPYDVSFSATVKNMTDKRYISSRRPQGIRLGAPRMFIFGISVKI